MDRYHIFMILHGMMQKIKNQSFKTKNDYSTIDSIDSRF